MTDPRHLTPGVNPFTIADTTDERQYRVLELGLQGLTDSAAMTLADIEDSLTFERRSDMQGRIAREYIAAAWKNMTDEQKAELQAALIAPFA